MKFIVEILPPYEIEGTSIPAFTWSNIKPALHIAAKNLGVQNVNVTDYPPAHAELLAEYRQAYARGVAEAGAQIWLSITEGPGACPDWA